MERQLKGRVSIVTGASRGIGRAIALHLAEAGSDLALAARKCGRHITRRVLDAVQWRKSVCDIGGCPCGS